jgi:hypothetical protein
MIRYILVSISMLTVGASAQVPTKINSDQLEGFVPHLYDSIMEENLRIYSGKRFFDPLSKKTIEGDIYYHSNDWTIGIVGYAGQAYPNVTMRYHTFLDKLIVLSPNGSDEIDITESKLDYFILYNKKFIKLKEPSEGFYTFLHSGDIEIFAHYYSSRHEKSLFITELENRQKYFIKKGNTIYQVTSKGSVLKVLTEHKAELRKFFRQQNLAFSKNREFSLQLLGAEFERLQNQK